mmetsp:Transcript_17597/g.36532  ORF Transcript_17597/g.36532 Transcript_17597/m.36532 type:complete len:102 (+) Transcript_17597:100-405(+)
MVTERGVGGKRAGSKERMSSPGKSWILQEAEGKLWKPTTLAHFLVDHEVPFERVRQLRPASHGLVTRVLGVRAERRGVESMRSRAQTSGDHGDKCMMRMMC